MTMIAYAFLQTRRLKAAGRRKVTRTRVIGRTWLRGPARTNPSISTPNIGDCAVHRRLAGRTGFRERRARLDGLRGRLIAGMRKRAGFPISTPRRDSFVSPPSRAIGWIGALF